MQRTLLATLFTTVSLLFLAACGSDDDGGTTDPPAGYPMDDVLRMQHIQAKGTHNSYHIESEGNGIALFAYTHVPLADQLAQQGVRHFELDLRVEADGTVVVFHELFDTETTCQLFTDCLQAIEGWSAASPGHHPLAVLLEPKDEVTAEGADAWLADVESDISSVWSPERLLTPDMVQGASASLKEAITTRGWPTLGESRGRVFFVLHDTGALRTAYTHGDADLAGRIMFVESSMAEPYASVLVLNDPIAQAAEIAAAVEAGFLVRTRADADTAEPRDGDTTRRDAALASGAQLVSTDFPAPVEGIDYSVEIPGGTPSRCNPLVSPEGCTSAAVEDPALLAP
jgi:hypothetical protein